MCELTGHRLARSKLQLSDGPSVRDGKMFTALNPMCQSTSEVHCSVTDSVGVERRVLISICRNLGQRSRLGVALQAGKCLLLAFNWRAAYFKKASHMHEALTYTYYSNCVMKTQQLRGVVKSSSGTLVSAVNKLQDSPRFTYTKPKVGYPHIVSKTHQVPIHEIFFWRELMQSSIDASDNGETFLGYPW